MIRFVLLVAAVAALTVPLGVRTVNAAHKPKAAHSERYWRAAVAGQRADRLAKARTIRRLERQLKVQARTLTSLRASNARFTIGSEQIRRLNTDIGYAIDYVFGPNDAPGARQVARCESTWDEIGLAALGADNGQGYYGIFQLGDPGKWEIREYAFWRYDTVLDQVLAAYRMYVHRGWGAWQCKPEGGLRW